MFAQGTITMHGNSKKNTFHHAYAPSCSWSCHDWKIYT